MGARDLNQALDLLTSETATPVAPMRRRVTFLTGCEDHRDVSSPSSSSWSSRTTAARRAARNSSML